MPFERKTLAENVAEVEAGLASRLPGADTRLRRAVLAVLARVVGGVVFGLDAFIAFVARQILPDTAEGENLRRHCRIWRVPPKLEEAATGSVAFAGAAGPPMPAGALMQRGDGVQYESTAEAGIQGGKALVPVRAVVAGAAGNAAAGTVLSLVSPQEGFEFSGTVAAGGIAGGVDAEQDARLRPRLIARIQRPPRGGSYADWERWALEVPGVTRAWPKPGWMGRGTVGLCFVMDDAEDIIPDDIMLARVREHVTSRTAKPVTADVYEFAPTRKAVDYTIRGLNPSTDAVRQAVRDELADLHRREAEPGRVLLLSHMRSAISTAAGEYDHALESPDKDVYCEKHEMPLLGKVDFLPKKTEEDGQ